MYILTYTTVINNPIRKFSDDQKQPYKFLPQIFRNTSLIRLIRQSQTCDHPIFFLIYIREHPIFPKFL